MKGLPSLPRLTLRLLALQLFGNAALLLAAALWLEIPDSHLWELGFSLLSAVAIVGGLLVLHATIIRHLRDARDLCPLWLGAFLLAIWVFLLSLPFKLGDLLGPAIYQRASYWNSQLSPGLRSVFTYERLSQLQLGTLEVVMWFLVPALLLPFLIETVTRGVRGNVWRTGLRALGQWRYGTACIVVALILHFLVLPLIDWTPGHSVTGEILSLVLRIGAVYVATVLMLTWLIACTASLLSERDGSRNAAAQPAENNSKPMLPDQ